jgi:hypothetical protein
MLLSLPRLMGLAGSGLAAAVFALAPMSALGQEEREIVIEKVVAQEKEDDDEDDKDDKDDKDDDDAKEQTSLWIGVQLEGTGGPEGLKIAEVLPDSPAAKAALKAGDVLIAVGDTKLEHSDRLIDLVQDSRGKTLKIKLLREGKEVIQEVRPAKRPGAKIERTEDPKPGQPAIAWRSIEVAPKAGASSGGSGTMHLYSAPKGAATPGPMLPQPMTARLTMRMPEPQLPDDMSVTISKKGNKPAVITAKQGDKVWKTTERELGMLPGPAQAYAARILGQNTIRTRNPGAAPGMGGMFGMPGMGGMMQGVAPPQPATGPGPARREVRSLELRLDKDGRVTGVQGGDTQPNVTAVPGGIQLEIRGAEEKGEKEANKAEKPAAETEAQAKARRIRQLQEQAEQLREQLNKLREGVKE